VDTKQRGPVLVFAALLGVAFLCLCLVVTAVGMSRLAAAVARSDQGGPATELTLPMGIPVTAPEPRTATEGASQPAQTVIEIDPSSDVEPQILNAVYQKVNPSVVKILSLGVVPAATDSQDLLPQGPGIRLSSGTARATSSPTPTWWRARTPCR
jgi:hypothetical protein